MTYGILLAGDADLFLDMGERLEKLGYSVAGTADTAEEAARLAKELTPEAVLVCLGGADTLKTVGVCRALQVGTATPIVLVVQAREDHVLDAALACEPSGVLLQPFWDGQLRATLKVALRGKGNLFLRNELDVHKVELEQQNQELREARDHMEILRDKYVQLYDFAPVGYMTTTENGLVSEANLTVCAMLGLQRSHVVGRPFSPFLARHSQPVWHAHLARIFKTGGRQECELTLRSVGLPIDLQAVSTDQPGAGGESTCLTALVDISERNRTRADLVQAKLDAEAASQAKSDFLANMSHELRTPLSGMLGMIDLVHREGALDKNAEEYLLLASESGRQLLAIINDILDLTRIETGRLVLMPAPFAVRPALETTLGLFASRAKSKGLAVSMDVSPTVPEHLVGDQTRLGQVLTNLVGNAVKFTDQGGITVRVAVTQASERADPGEVMLLFAVEDTGIGIAPDKHETIFESFVQVDGSFSRHYGGMGLGLAICKRLVKFMGGRIWLESRPGAGSTFFFTASFDAVAVAASAGKAPTRPTEHPPDSLRILVAEDDPINRMYLRVSLEELGHVVGEAANGKEVLEMLAQEAFDMVFMDVQMPQLDGEEATKIIRQTPPAGVSSAIPIVALTAHALVGDQERFLKAGMNKYLAKPVALDKLVQVLAWAMENRPGGNKTRQPG